MEHRQAHRVSADITVMLHTADGVSCKACIKNVSSLGAGIVLTQGMLTRGTMVRVQILSSAQKQRSINMQSHGYVVRHTDNEFGLLWVDANERSPMFGNQQHQATRQKSELLTA